MFAISLAIIASRISEMSLDLLFISSFIVLSCSVYMPCLQLEMLGVQARQVLCHIL